MLDVQDELTDLAAALGGLTEIRSLLRVMGEVVGPAEASGGKPSADRIGTAAVELFEESLDEYVRAKNEYNDPHDLIDQTSVPGLAYCDFGLVDKRSREFVRQGQLGTSQGKTVLFSDARPFVSTMGKLVGDQRGPLV